jgi:hypothetical protein
MPQIRERRSQFDGWHSVTTMWRSYAAWMEGALETDIAPILAR